MQDEAWGARVRHGDDDIDGGRWEARRGLAASLSTAAAVAPAVAAGATAYAVGRLLGRPDGVAEGLRWWVAVLLGSVATLVVVDRATRRLRPLASLLRLSLAFPGPAPSRLRLGLRRARPGDARSPGDLLALVVALDQHDHRTRGHAERVAAYAEQIATDLGVPATDRERLKWAALLHDVGKLEVPSALLAQEATPSAADRAELARHSDHAAAVIEPLRPWLGEWADAVTQHHERPDGQGYPAGLHGDELALGARIVAVADAYDAMTSPRSYRRPLSTAEARDELLRHRGTQFDPMVVRALLHVSEARMHRAAGPLCWLGRSPAARHVLTATGGRAAPAFGAIGAVAVVAAATLAGLALPVAGDHPDEAAASSGASTAEPGAGGEASTSTSGAPGTTDTTGGRGDGGDRRGDSADEDGDDDGPRAGEAGEAGDTERSVAEHEADGDGTTSTTGPDDDDDDPPGTSTTAPPDTSTTTDPPRTTTTRPPTTTTAPPRNRPPVAVADSASVTILSTTSIDVLGNDRDDDGRLDASTLTITSGPAVGAAQVVAGRIRYNAPLLGGAAEIGYRICDDDGACDTAVLSITIRLL